MAGAWHSRTKRVVAAADELCQRFAAAAGNFFVGPPLEAGNGRPGRGGAISRRSAVNVLCHRSAAVCHFAIAGGGACPPDRGNLAPIESSCANRLGGRWRRPVLSALR